MFNPLPTPGIVFGAVHGRRRGSHTLWRLGGRHTGRTISFIMKKVLIAKKLIALLGDPKLMVATISPYEGAGGKLIAGDLDVRAFAGSGRPG